VTSSEPAIDATVSSGIGPARVPVSEAEVAAVAAAYTVLTAGGDGGPDAASTPRWRFSGRWWAKPVPAVRQRP
jgi:hypothetical protein